MLFSEIIKMALASLGANKLRAALTMIGITIGVFSVISVLKVSNFSVPPSGIASLELTARFIRICVI